MTKIFEDSSREIIAAKPSIQDYKLDHAARVDIALLLLYVVILKTTISTSLAESTILFYSDFLRQSEPRAIIVGECRIYSERISLSALIKYAW
jgi:hypothetical protein